MASYDYRCENEECLFEDFEVRTLEHRDDPLFCPQCKGEMRYKFTSTVPYVKIKDRKVLRLPGRAPILKERHRILGTEIGRIRPQKLADDIHAMEQRYASDVKAIEQEEKTGVVASRTKRVP